MGGVDDSGELGLTEKRTAHTCDRAGFSPARVAATLPAICVNLTSGPVVPADAAPTAATPAEADATDTGR
jgi:hypothetical protein